MVAAWISADTGVGPSIASGNQVCSINCADLPIAPINNSIVITSRAFNCHDKNWNEVLLNSLALCGSRTSEKFILHDK